MELSIYRYLLLSLVWPSYRPQSVVLACLVGRLSWSVVHAGSSCRLSCRACSCGLVTSLLAVATAPPWVPSGDPTGDPQEAGGDFSKRGERLTETRPVPIFMREVKKNVVFQRKTGKIQFETVVFKCKTGENGEKILESGGSQGESGESQGAEKKEVPLTRPKDMRDGQRSGTDTK